MKLWEKDIHTDQMILDFTIGEDRKLDIYIARFDVIASIAHAKMLAQVNILEKAETEKIVNNLIKIYDTIEKGTFKIDDESEDVHSQLEKILIDELGETGKKIHTARSRNDQVLVACKLFYREEIINTAVIIKGLVEELLKKAEDSKSLLLPGYTHMQAAMYSSFGLWFSAWAEAFTEDLYFLRGIFDYVNLNPLGSAAGYGSSFPIDRAYTTVLLEFGDYHINSINAQLARGKTEKMLLAGLSSIAGTISKMAYDMILFLNQNFNFLSLDDDLTTGSSIMPHKKNPDVLELLRAKCNRIQAREFEVLTLINNLPSGYHRDFQLLKEIAFPSVSELKECLLVMKYIIPKLKLNENATEGDIYKYLGSVDAINEKVKEGISFRDAYREIAKEIKEGSFKPPVEPEHTHRGSIGDLSMGRISDKLDKICNSLRIEKYTGFQKRFIDKIVNEEV
ncbi:MAG: argininosuccinate lyase [Bacteroidota bacterium]